MVDHAVVVNEISFVEGVVARIMVDSCEKPVPRARQASSDPLDLDFGELYVWSTH